MPFGIDNRPGSDCERRTKASGCQRMRRKRKGRMAHKRSSVRARALSEMDTSWGRLRGQLPGYLGMSKREFDLECKIECVSLLSGVVCECFSFCSHFLIVLIRPLSLSLCLSASLPRCLVLCELRSWTYTWAIDLVHAGHFRIAFNCHAATIALFCLPILCHLFFYLWLSVGFLDHVTFFVCPIQTSRNRSSEQDKWHKLPEPSSRPCSKNPAKNPDSSSRSSRHFLAPIKIKRKLSVNMRILSHKSPHREGKGRSIHFFLA